jgi:hypothetical protein
MITGARTRSRLDNALHCIPLTKDPRCRAVLIEVAEELIRSIPDLTEDERADYARKLTSENVLGG